jgi:glucose-6-phosphate dehydrogenase assembly protein OpcA
VPSDSTLGEWSGEDIRVGDLDRQLAELRSPERGVAPDLRTSVMTHIAWVPPEWQEAAQETRVGLGARNPSRVIVLCPDPDAGADRIDARIEVEAYEVPGAQRQISSEVIELRLCGGLCVDPASIVAPLVMADLPVFIRWRGRPPFGGDGFERVLDVVDRLIVNSAEWPDVPEAYQDFARCFDRAACSDIAWRRTELWRIAIAGLWPGVAKASELRVRGPRPEAFLLTGWLRTRLDRPLELALEEADRLEAVSLDGTVVEPPEAEPPTSSDLLSAELEVQTRDRIFEQAAVAAVDLAPLAA